jgi:hypothetical protein
MQDSKAAWLTLEMLPIGEPGCGCPNRRYRPDTDGKIGSFFKSTAAVPTTDAVQNHCSRPGATGVPLEIPRTASGGTDWDALLGAPGADPSDFAARNSATAVTTQSAEGPISMRANNPDPDCPTRRTTPACRR